MTEDSQPDTQGFDAAEERRAREAVEAAIARDEPDELLHVPIDVSMEPWDCRYSQDVCVRLSRHPHFNVRGNAILGFGHLARTCGALAEATVRPIVEAALDDPHEYVRGHAFVAACDLNHFLGWRIPLPGDEEAEDFEGEPGA